MLRWPQTKMKREFNGKKTKQHKKKLKRQKKAVQKKKHFKAALLIFSGMVIPKRTQIKSKIKISYKFYEKVLFSGKHQDAAYKNH